MNEASLVNLTAIQDTPVWSLGWEDPLENGMATHFSILAWRIPWTEEPGGLQSMAKSWTWLRDIIYSFTSLNATELFITPSAFHSIHRKMRENYNFTPKKKDSKRWIPPSALHHMPSYEPESFKKKVKVLVTQYCLILCGPWPTKLLCPWDSPGKNTGVGSHSLLQGIFPTQGSDPGLLPCRQILYHLSPQGSPIWSRRSAQRPHQSRHFRWPWMSRLQPCVIGESETNNPIHMTFIKLLPCGRHTAV